MRNQIIVEDLYEAPAGEGGAVDLARVVEGLIGQTFQGSGLTIGTVQPNPLWAERA